MEKNQNILCFAERVKGLRAGKDNGSQAERNTLGIRFKHWFPLGEVRA